MLWAIPIGIAIGWLLRGGLDGLLQLHFRWPWLAVGGLLVQVVLFTPVGSALAGDSLVPPIYIASTLAVLVAVLRNIRLAGMAIVALGAFSNLIAITANGGYMPASAGALELAGFADAGEHTNSVVLDDPAFEPLTDIYAIPDWLPLANVFSVGDVLIGAGVAIAIAAAMRRGRAARSSSPG
jgi:hypothetical protein